MAIERREVFTVALGDGVAGSIRLHCDEVWPWGLGSFWISCVSSASEGRGQGVP